MTINSREFVPFLKNSRLRCVLIGSEALLTECGQHLERSGHDILAVVSDRPEIVGWAMGRSLRTFPNMAALLAASDLPPFDYLFSIANLSIVPPAVLALPEQAAINFHDGPLPDLGGVNTPSWALIEGASGHGVTWHLMTADVDAGGVLARRRFPLEDGETALSLHRKNFVAGLESFEELIDRLSSVGAVPLEPAAAPRRMFRRVDRPDAAGTIRWDQRAERIERLVRGLDFGGRPNPLGTAKAIFEGHRLIIRDVGVAGGACGLAPGSIVRANDKAIVVATASNDLIVRGLADAGGETVALADALVRFGLRAGAAFDVITTAQAHELSTIDAQLATHEGFWSRRLTGLKPLDLPNATRRLLPGTIAMADQALPVSDDPSRCDTVLAALTASLARLADSGDFDVGFNCPLLAAPFVDVAGWFAPQLPLRVAVDLAAPFDVFRDTLLTEIGQLHRRIGHGADLAARTPGARATPLPVAITLVDRIEDAVALPGVELSVAITRDGKSCRWSYDDARYSAAAIAAMQQQFATLLAAADADPATSVADLPLLDPIALAEVLEGRNATAGPWRHDACIHHLIAEQALRTPDQAAVTCNGQSLTYAELDAAAAGWARRLHGLGVKPDSLVGIFVERSVDLVVGVLAVLKAGGAYVPLDPAYPADRIAHMIADAGASVIVTQSHLVDRLPGLDAVLLCLDDGAVSAGGGLDADFDARFDGGATPDNLAYVIYTSGSTGRPKGVMVEHRNAVNFFAGIDARVSAPGVWLAVTSLSFDISVLELCWTLTRGFTVVIYTGDDRRTASEPRSTMASRPLDFSLFYFASDATESATDKYRLLLDGAKYGDREGFCGVWTPERHFHAFGGLYPNPAITSAAIAAVTSRIGIRAGSCVLPLHHPIRVAEDWSVVDNLSNGRVSISFAAGWQPDDFVLAPDNFRTAKDVMLRDVDVVRRLWRGEAVAFPGPLGNTPAITILPRPVQPELPFWLTSAGNVETFEAAGRIGASVLTHLLGQTVEELTDKLAAYRRAWREAGHPGNGRAALMLHSFVGEDEAMVRATVRGPMIEYLRSSASLIKQYAWSFPAFKRRAGMDGAAAGVELDGLDAGEMTALLDHAFERYYETSGLFGTPDGCMAMIDRIKRAGVDEIACLIDFGIDSATVMAHLPQLNAVRRKAMPAVDLPRIDDTEPQDIPALIARHGVTHLQCTPSMASLLMADDRAHAALASLQTMLVGGEAFPPALARDMERLVGGTVMNMYGPTETTIWSTTATLDSSAAVDAQVSLGTPLLNQQVYILDSRGRPVPDGIPGELVIGGAGVTRGYLRRPELTADRFVPHPFGGAGKVYRTGDLARFDADGRIEFLGRLDNQVKIRGHRIELGEIEAELAALPAVDEAVVVALATGPGDVRLVGYVTGGSCAAVDLREQLRQRLPDVMVPAQVVVLAAMPRTPNGKIDRKALPQPETVLAAPIVAAEPPAEGVEARIAAIWCNVLKIPGVGANDNFFDLGGHSLLAVQVHRQLRDSIGGGLAITDVFRYPTIRALAARLADGVDNRAAVMGQNRASERLAAMGRRRTGITPTAVSVA